MALLPLHGLMFDLQNPPFPVIAWNDDKLAGKVSVEGNDGWYTEYFPGKLVIFVAGTWWDDAGYGDIWVNIKLWPRFTRFGAVHSGYDEYASKLIILLFKMNILDSDKEIVLIGHSMGGAVASIAAMYLRCFGYNVSIHLFASSVVGSRKFCENFKQAFPNCKNEFVGNDIVQFIPIFTFGIYHSAGKKIIHNKKHGTLQNWLKGFIMDHYPSEMKSYIEIPIKSEG